MHSPAFGKLMDFGIFGFMIRNILMLLLTSAPVTISKPFMKTLAMPQPPLLWISMAMLPSGWSRKAPSVWNRLSSLWTHKGENKGESTYSRIIASETPNKSCGILFYKSKNPGSHNNFREIHLAEMEGFEPPHALRRLADFESAPFSHLGTSP